MMKAMNIRIKTVSPVILSALGHASVMTATHDFFSGSVLRGIFAARFIEKQKLDKIAHTDADFMRLFYGDLRFVDAYPVDPETGARAIVLPFSVQRSKDEREIRDLLQKGTELAPGFKGMKGFAAAADGVLRPVKVRKNITLHMSRTDLKDDSGMERLAGKSRSSGIYNYESIAAGQSFEGVIYGAAELLAQLRDVLGTQFTCYAGRSKYTQYGQCEVTLTQPQDIPEGAAPQGERLCIRLETPLLPRAGIPGDAASMLAEIVTALNEKTSGGFSLSEEQRSIFAKEAEIDNFVGQWCMKRPRETGLAAGSVFALEKAGGWQDGDAEALRTVLYEGVGRRRAEGFGQLRLWDGRDIRRAEKTERSAVKPRELGAEAKKIAAAILTAHVVEQIRVLASMDVETARIPSGARHALSRLEQELGTRSDRAISRMRDFAVSMQGKKTPLGKMMTGIRVNGISLLAYFHEKNIADMPYFLRGKELLRSEVGDIADELGIAHGIEGILREDQVFYAYWHAFFRFARKRAERSEEGGTEV